MNAEMPLNNDITSTNSLFTIVLLKGKTESKLTLYEQKHIEIFTTDYSIPWLSVVCSEVFLEEK